MKRILVVDDHPMFRDAVFSAVGLAFPGVEVREAGTIDAACAIVEEQAAIDLLLLDLMLPGVSGFDGLLLIRKRFPRLPVLVVSGMEDPRIAAEAIRLGAAGFAPKSISGKMLAEALTNVMNGDVYLSADLANAVHRIQKPTADGGMETRLAELTATQIRVLQHIRQGLLNKQIAYELGVGETTVKAHVSEILRKLNVATRTLIVIETANLDFEAVMKGWGDEP